MTTKTAQPEHDHISLKWGALKAWHVHSDECLELLRRYFDKGVPPGCAMDRPNGNRKAILCELIDRCTADKIFLDWEGKDVSKEDAKKYVMEYGAS